MAWQTPEVRLSSHTIALCSGCPVERSHTSVVSPARAKRSGEQRQVRGGASAAASRWAGTGQRAGTVCGRGQGGQERRRWRIPAWVPAEPVHPKPARLPTDGGSTHAARPLTLVGDAHGAHRQLWEFAPSLLHRLQQDQGADSRMGDIPLNRFESSRRQSRAPGKGQAPPARRIDVCTKLRRAARRPDQNGTVVVRQQQWQPQ